MNSNESSASSDAAASLPRRVCANCGAAAEDAYCPACGQETRAPPTPAEFLRQYLAGLLSLESKALGTLRKLFFTPGGLTVEYVAGRRARYVRPLRLYLWISVLTIATAETFGLHLALRVFGDEGIYLFEPRGRTAGEAQDTVDELRPMRFVLDHFDTPGLRRFKALSVEEQVEFTYEQRHRYVQYFLLFLVPFFALILQLCYQDRRRPYAEHLVFFFHAQSFLLLMLLIEAKVPDPVAMVISLCVIAYFFVALKRVYGGGWVENAVRGGAVVVLNVATFLVAGAALVYASLEL